MSLKALHIVFITASVLLCLGFAWWLYAEYQTNRSLFYLVSSAASGLSGLGLIGYEVSVIKKFRHIAYL